MQSNECADMMCIPKTSFIRLVREIAAQCSPARLRFERDALVAAQIASETFITMIFEMASVPCYSSNVDVCRNRLALHAKRVTVMPRDVELVRELWRYIKPDDPIAQMSDETVHGIVRANRLDEVLKMKQRKAAYERREHLRALGSRVPPSLDHYLKGVSQDRAGNFVRSAIYKKITV
jgi:histone H3/H4